MAPTTSASLVPSLTENLLQILKDDDRRIQTVAEIISEVREAVITVDNPPDPSEIRKQQLQLAEVKVKLMETKDALEKCVALQDFSQASVLKECITELENKKSDLLKEAEQPQTKEICMEKVLWSNCGQLLLEVSHRVALEDLEVPREVSFQNDPETLLKCLIMCNELLKQLSSSKGLGPTLDGIIESLIIPGVTNIHPAVRNTAVLCLSCCALQSKDFASQHLALLLQVLQLDEMKIKLSALKAIFDQLMTFGIEPFKENKEGNSQNENDKDENETIKETEHNLLQLISGFLDSEFSELRTVSAEGLAKLMFTGRLISAKLLSRLILLWYNPVTEEDVRLRHSLGVFFPLFAYSNRTNQECFEEAFLPTLHILFNAPATSPLSEVDISNVAELLVDLTRPSGLDRCTKNTQNFPGLTAHDNLALKLCNEILKDPSSPDVRIYTKALSSLELNKDFAKDLLVLLGEVHEEVKDKACLRMIEKVKRNLNGRNHLNGDISGVSQESTSSQVSRDTDGTTVVRDGDRTSDPNDQSEEANKETAQPTEENVATKSRSVRSKAVKGAREIEAKSVPRRRARTTADSGSESSEEVHQAALVTNSRPSRQAKTAALGKTKKNLSQFLDTE